MATKGSNVIGNGSIDKPFQTLSHACKKIHGGSGNIYIEAGEYEDDGYCELDENISIIGEGFDVTIINATYPGWYINGSSENHVDGNNLIQGFMLDGSNKQLKYGVNIRNRNHVKINKMFFKDIEAAAIQIATQGSNKNIEPNYYLNNIIISNNVLTNCAKDYDGWSGGCIQIGHVDGGEIFSNKIVEKRGGGIKQWGGGWFKNVEIYNNDINVPGLDPFWGADISIELWNVIGNVKIYGNELDSWMSIVKSNKGDYEYSVRIYNNNINIRTKDNQKEAIEISGVSDAYVYNNNIENAKYGISIWSDYVSENNKIFKNIIKNREDGEGIRLHRGVNNSIYENAISNVHQGIVLHSAKSNMYNNLVHDNLLMNIKRGVVFISNEFLIENTIISNNVFINNGQDISDRGKKKVLYEATYNSNYNPNSSR